MSFLELIGRIAIWAVSGCIAAYWAFIIAVFIDEIVNPGSGLGGIVMPLWMMAITAALWIAFGLIWVGGKIQ